MCCVALPCSLFDLASSFFFPSLISHYNMYMYMYIVHVASWFGGWVCLDSLTEVVVANESH